MQKRVSRRMLIRHRTLALRPKYRKVNAPSSKTHNTKLLINPRPSANSVQFLSRPGHSPIVDLTWSPWGKYLASSSPADRAMMIWEVSRDVATPTSQLGGGIGVIRWAPCGTHLFAATTSSLFRVWETRNWTCEKWSNMSNRCNVRRREKTRGEI